MSETNVKKAYNPTITAFFPTRNGSGNFSSKPIDTKAFDVIQKNISIGNRLLLKTRTAQDQETGQDYTYFFLEILPPSEEATERRGNTKAAKASKVSEDSV